MTQYKNYRVSDPHQARCANTTKAANICALTHHDEVKNNVLRRPPAPGYAYGPKPACQATTAEDAYLIAI